MKQQKSDCKQNISAPAREKFLFDFWILNLAGKNLISLPHYAPMIRVACCVDFQGDKLLFAPGLHYLVMFSRPYTFMPRLRYATMTILTVAGLCCGVTVVGRRADALGSLIFLVCQQKPEQAFSAATTAFVFLVSGRVCGGYVSSRSLQW